MRYSRSSAVKDGLIGGMTVRKLLWTVVIVVLVAAALVAGDYRGLFGTQERTYVDYAHVTFVPVDAATKKPIEQVVVNCFVPKEESACTMRRRDGEKRTVEVNLGIVRVETRTRLFSKGERVLGAETTPVHIMFIHPNYERVTRSYKVADLLRMREGHTVVELPAARG